MEDKYYLFVNDDWAEVFVLRENGNKEQLYQGHYEDDAYNAVVTDLHPNIVEYKYEDDGGWAEEHGEWGMEYFENILAEEVR